jgi:hypothetical protein
MLSGCVLDQTHSKADHETFSLKSDDQVKAAGNLIDTALAIYCSTLTIDYAAMAFSVTGDIR